jgi:hypothetical protein
MPELKVDRTKILQAAGKKRVGPSTTTLSLSGLRSSVVGGEVFEGAPRHIKRLNLLLYGPPGTGKTVNAHKMPNTRTLDLDNGMQSVEWAIMKGIIKKDPSEIVYKTILQEPNNFKSANVIDECCDTVDEWIADEDISPDEWDRPYPQFWDTLVIDGGTGLTDSAIILALHENARLELSKSLGKMKSGLGITPIGIQDWGSASSLFQKFINQCRARGKNVVLICHEYQATDDDGNTIAIEPGLIGQLRQKIAKDFDEVWYAHVTGSRNEPQYKFQTTPDPMRRLRSRLGCLDPVESADFDAIKKKIAKFYKVDEKLLWIAAHGSEEIAALNREESQGASGI